jgi:large subunit ribosomal protein L9
MDVILLERVEKLGGLGDVVSVKPGYARNFLLPQGKALRATDANRKRFESERTNREHANAELRSKAEGSAGTIGGMSCVLIRQASETLQLYGSVTARDIAQAATAAGAAIERQQVILDKPIKTLGLHTVRVALHPEVSVEITVNVARSPEEAEVQAKTGVAGSGTPEEEDEAAPELAELLEQPVAAEGEEQPAEGNA